MAIIHPCHACQYGMHDEHVDVPGPVSEGIIGGWVCECKGECVENYKPQKHIIVSDAQESTEKIMEAYAFLKALGQD